MLKKLLLISTLSLISCTNAPFLYVPDITQGNAFTKEQIALIQVGMPREQVRLILGTPTIADPFHPEMDIYNFAFTSGKEHRRYTKKLTITYNQENLVVNVQEGELIIRKE